MVSIRIDKDQILRAAEHTPHGLLLGISCSDEITVIGVCNNISRSTNTSWLPSRIDTDTFYQYVPAGIRLVGLFASIKLAEHVNWQNELEQFIIKQKCCSDVKAIAILDTDSGELAYYDRSYVSMAAVPLTQNYLDLHFTTLHVKDCITISLPKDYKQVTQSLVRIRNLMKGSSLHIPQCGIISSDKGSGTISNSTSGDKLPRILAAELLQHNAVDHVSPLVLTLTPCDHTHSISVPINVVGISANDTPLSSIVGEIKEKLLNQLTVIARIIEEERCVPVTYQYLVDYLPLSIMYPFTNIDDGSSCSDDMLLPQRQQLHNLFCLPLTRPHFRLSNIKWNTRDSQQLILNPHLHLKTPQQGSVAMVTGSYSYHHYMQDGFNDSGWGCAYRSLQTLWSWFRYQGYTTRPIPSHREMQTALVECGDKLQSFVGSNEWIGSVEVSIVLNHLLQVDCKIHYVATGKEMASTARILLHHFTSQGTPIMIGGGVLAHTILGVQYNQQTGDVKYLILDPHYTGQDDIKHIIGKWCGWKALSFWDATASYNMCMPIRPLQY